jgi:hypothetical protein
MALAASTPNGGRRTDELTCRDLIGQTVTQAMCDLFLDAQTCNRTHGYYLAPDSNKTVAARGLADFAEDDLGMKNVPCVGRDDREDNAYLGFLGEDFDDCRTDPDACDAGSACVANDHDENPLKADQVAGLNALQLNQTGICVPCIVGQYCPAGTVTQGASATENLCPVGKICKMPGVPFEDCPAGTFCPAGSFIEGMAGSTDCNRLGMHCLNGTQPDSLYCPQGYYCPASDMPKIECPLGHFCWKGSHKPHPCAMPGDLMAGFATVQCPAGSSTKPLGLEGIVISGIVLGAIVLVLFLLKLTRRGCRATRVANKSGIEDVDAAAYRDNLLKEIWKTSSQSSANTDTSFTPRSGIKFEFKDLGLKLRSSFFENFGKAEAAKEPRVIFEGVSGTVRASTITAVMGPSGAGKTSLMNVLCDRAGYGVTEGKLYINGRIGRMSEHRDVLGFVPQDDVVHEELTVRENLLYSAMRRLPIPNAKTASCRTKTLCVSLLCIIILWCYCWC